ncbi:hypothetical protein M433DRAFT_1563 [Acidomyces richmondensis BFW]|nr:hypothetical protein M433DRAFT_1563 [Acidomyces richmondensis BFW]
MPALFSRGRRASSNPPLDRSTINAATAAAGQAFLANSSSHASLSSAAAAAALRSQTTSPEPVGSIQTKRMARRGSTSSVGSSVRGAGRGGLQRVNSSGSMTERTFRSPSPGRQNRAVVPEPDAPPVPVLPQSIAPSRLQRSNSLEPPQRVMSPTLPKGKRGSSVDVVNLSSDTLPRQRKRISNVTEPGETDKRDSVSGSINFSRPMSNQSNPNSPSAGAKKYTHGMGGWFSQPVGEKEVVRPKTSDGLPGWGVDANFVAQDVINASSKPVGKRQLSVGNAPGSHLSRANRTASYEVEDSLMVFDPNTRTFVARPRDKPLEAEPPSPIPPQTPPVELRRWDPNTRSVVPTNAQGLPISSDVPEALDIKKKRPTVAPVRTALSPPPRNPARMSPGSSSPTSPRAAGILHKQPSIVREDPEGEEEAEVAMSSQPGKTNGHSKRISSGPSKAYSARAPAPHQRSTSLDVPRQSIEGPGRVRNGSMSPPRSAHFSPSPVIETHRHVPPPRDLSPVKSALKHSPSSSLRAVSPIATSSPSTAPMPPPSDASDTTSLHSHDGVQSKKKKGVRVSFDDQPEEIDAVGAAALPKAILGRDRSPIPAMEDDENIEVMKPRPVLPSFGSIRRNRPLEPEMPEKVTEVPPERDGASSDHAIGGILANANRRISVDEKDMADVNKPLPPEVMSKEADGFEVSDDSEEEFSFRPEAASTPAKAISDPASEAVTAEGAIDAADVSHNTQSKAPIREPAVVPAINLLPPTPGEDGKPLGDEGEDEEEENPRSSFDLRVPGGWDVDESDSNTAEASVAKSQPPAADQIGVLGISSESPVENHLSAKNAESITPETQNTSTILHAIDEDTDDGAEFSDAAEDLSDQEDGGFASLDAIVASPIASSPVADKGKISPLPESPNAKQEAKEAAPGSGDWSQATAYWSNLTKQQKEQIEREHFPGDDEKRPPPAAAKKKKPASKAVSGVTASEMKTGQDEPTERAMPRTMRAKAGPTPADVSLKRSMRPARSDDTPAIRATMRSGPPSQQRPQSSSTPVSDRSGPTRSLSAVPFSASAGGAALRQRSNSDDMPRSQDSAFPKLQTKRASQQPPASQQQPKRMSSPNPVVKGGAFTQKLQKKVTDDSDSESSFRKKRRPSGSVADSSGRYSMRRSMRAGSFDSATQRPASPTPAGRRGGGTFSLRSLSPTGSSWGRKKSGNFRETLRSGSNDMGSMRPTLRSSSAIGGSATRSTSRPSITGSTASKSRFRSRFAPDSDDDGDEDSRPVRSLFKSRFADSDDEDDIGSPGFMPADLTPVRGIPRRIGQNDGDSTDLEDENDEEPNLRKASRKRQRHPKPLIPDPADVDKAMEAARRKLGIQTPESKEGQALGKGSLRPMATSPSPAEPKSRGEDVQDATPTKRRGFLGSILRRNRASQTSVMMVNSTPASPVGVTTSPAGGSYLQAADGSAPSSPSHGKLVRRGTGQTRLTRGDSNFSNATAPAATTVSIDSENWPLPPPVPKIPTNGTTITTDPRPMTSDGVSAEAVRLARKMRPDLARRTFSGQQLGGRKVRMAPDAKEEDGGSELGEHNSRTVYSRRTGKKKRFGMLRRAFGLND